MTNFRVGCRLRIGPSHLANTNIYLLSAFHCPYFNEQHELCQVLTTSITWCGLRLTNSRFKSGVILVCCSGTAAQCSRSTPKTKSSTDSISCFILGLSPSYGKRRILSNRLSSYIGFIFSVSLFCPSGRSHHHIYLPQINLFKVVLKSLKQFPGRQPRASSTDRDALLGASELKTRMSHNDFTLGDQTPVAPTSSRASFAVIADLYWNTSPVSGNRGGSICIFLHLVILRKFAFMGIPFMGRRYLRERASRKSCLFRSKLCSDRGRVHLVPCPRRSAYSREVQTVMKGLQNVCRVFESSTFHWVLNLPWSQQPHAGWKPRVLTEMWLVRQKAAWVCPYGRFRHPASISQINLFKVVLKSLKISKFLDHIFYLPCTRVTILI
eukprot:sb/3465656/